VLRSLRGSARGGPSSPPSTGLRVNLLRTAATAAAGALALLSLAVPSRAQPAPAPVPALTGSVADSAVPALRASLRAGTLAPQTTSLALCASANLLCNAQVLAAKGTTTPLSSTQPIGLGATDLMQAYNLTGHAAGPAHDRDRRLLGLHVRRARVHGGHRLGRPDRARHASRPDTVRLTDQGDEIDRPTTATDVPGTAGCLCRPLVPRPSYEGRSCQQEHATVVLPLSHCRQGARGDPDGHPLTPREGEPVILDPVAERDEGVGLDEHPQGFSPTVPGQSPPSTARSTAPGRTTPAHGPSAPEAAG